MYFCNGHNLWYRNTGGIPFPVRNFPSNHYPFVSQDLVWDSSTFISLYEALQEYKKEILIQILILILILCLFRWGLAY